MQHVPWLRRTLTAVALGAAAGLLPLVSAGAAHADDIPDLSTPQVAYDNRATVAPKGVAARGADGALLYSARTGTASFAPFQSLGGVIVGDPSVAVTSNGTEFFVRGTDDRVYTNAVTSSGAVTGYSLVPGLTVSGEVESVVPVEEPAGSVRIFARGQDGAVWTNVRRNGAWVGWTSLGGFITSDITAGRLITAFGGGSIRIFVRGSDNRVYINRISTTGSSGYQVVDDMRVTSDIAVQEDNAINALEIFARGEDNRVYQRDLFVTGSTWKPVNGVTATSDIAVAKGALFVRGGDNAIYASPRSNGDGSFGAFQRIAGDATGNPAAYQLLNQSGGPVNQTLLARRPDGALGFNVQPYAVPPGPFGGYTPIAGANVG